MLARSGTSPQAAPAGGPRHHRLLVLSALGWPPMGLSLPQVDKQLLQVFTNDA